MRIGADCSPLEVRDLRSGVPRPIGRTKPASVCELAEEEELIDLAEVPISINYWDPAEEGRQIRRLPHTEAAPGQQRDRVLSSHGRVRPRPPTWATRDQARVFNGGFPTDRESLVHGRRWLSVPRGASAFHTS